LSPRGRRADDIQYYRPKNDFQDCISFVGDVFCRRDRNTTCPGSSSVAKSAAIAESKSTIQSRHRAATNAAGEEKTPKDDQSGFKLSGSVRFIAKKLNVSNETASFICFLFNFLVTAGVILWACGKYLPVTFKARTASIQKAMQEAQKASEEAQRRLAEIESRLKKLDVEIGTMRDNAEKEAAAEEARIQAATQEEARKIAEAARQEIEATAKAARRALAAYAADLAVGLASRQIRVDANADQALLRNFAGQLGSSSSDLERTDPGPASGKDRN
jgi:F0F1-type ATP synthase membrane subunit b/b'